MADPYEKPRQTLLLDRVGTDGRVGRITLNRPEKLNALSQELLYELNDALHELEADFDTRVILLRGAGRVFSAGYDLSPSSGRDHDAVSHSYRSEDEQGRKLVMGTRTAMQQVVDIQMYFWNMGKVTVAQLHGFCLAGGCELAMLADLVVAADDTQIGHPGNRFGTSRTGVIWPLVLGMRQAKELYLTGSSVSGEEAERIGMINHAWPADELEDRAIEYADYIANIALYPPSQRDTVDSIPESANQTNLAIVSAIGLNAYAAMTGDQHYSSTAKSFVNKLVNESDSDYTAHS